MSATRSWVAPPERDRGCGARTNFRTSALLAATRSAVRRGSWSWSLVVLVVGVLGVLPSPATALPAPPALLDDFSGPLTGWTAVPSDGVALALVPVEGALCLDFDFRGHGGWAIARKAVDLELPANYRLSFRLKGPGVGANHLELKLLDTSGLNVWWKNRRDFVFPAEWTELRTKKRQIEFAWGPAGGGEPGRIVGIEIGVVAGTGGAGRVCLDDLVLEELPPERPYSGEPVQRRSAGRVELDFGEARELGGLSVRWQPGDESRDYALFASDDLVSWRLLRRVRGGRGATDELYLPETEARALRLELAAGSVDRVVDLAVRTLAVGASPNAFFQSLADEAPRGRYPRGFAHQQVYWTVVGSDGGRSEALLSEDGAVELGKGRGSLEPFLLLPDEGLVGWPDVTAEASLHGGDLPIPTVTWRHPRFRLAVTALMAEGEVLWLRYRLDNVTTEPLRGRFVLALRPFQVNPPSQFLGTPGGVAQIRNIRREGDRIHVDGQAIELLDAPDTFGAATFDHGDPVTALLQGSLPTAQAVHDEDFGYASAVAIYELELAAGESREVVLRVIEERGSAELKFGRYPRAINEIRGSGRPSGRPDPQTRSQRRAGGGAFADALATTAAAWRAQLSQVTLELPPAAGPVAATARTALAHILINRDGPAIQPGSRAYERSWIRDGALTGAALLRFGHTDEVGEYLDWFAPFLFEDGKVPCCVDHRGADPVPENDSHGEFLHLVAEHFRFTGDRARAERLWPDVARVVAYLDRLRRTRRTAAYETDELRPFFGLLPESISHEGYSARPVHSYWDDFWALRGLRDAAGFARALGRPEAESFAALAEEFGHDLRASLARVIERHRLDTLPGSVELADYDPTSSTIALVPGGEQRRLPQPQLQTTFDRYFEGVLARLGGAGDGTYTPYELRTVGTFARLGQPERAARLLEIFLADRRPPSWNQWPEVLRRDPRAVGFLGDLPHTWVASDFLRSVAEMLAYEDEDEASLVLGAGLPAAWLETPEGVAVAGLRTAHGAVHYRVAAVPEGLRWSLGAGLTVPPGGLVLSWPFPELPAGVTVDGRAVPVPPDGRVWVNRLPAEVVLRLSRD
ncbi:MAG: coagulation factor 5/8 type domain-containing protein [Thermoanaerobaculia bacterium]|nr:coagulation factor 5/8 type domain-containing protein [Thermoanaerobaculia bacterium]